METRLNTLKSLRQKVAGELEKNLLPFWLDHAKDGRHEGGFTARMTNELVKESAPKGLVLHGRLLWTFSKLFGYKQDLRYFQLARQCYGYIVKHFLDPSHGGAYWMLDAEGHRLDMSKKTYGQAFLIYALSEYYKCCQISSVRKQATDLFYKLEEHALDSDKLGYFEVCQRDWTLADNQMLSHKDMDEKKSMNTHLHLLEAFTNLYSIWKNDLLRCRLVMLLEIFREKILQPDNSHFGLFFDDAWHVRSKGVSFGHEIEAAWLICEAAKVLDDSDLLIRYEYIAGMLAEKVHAEGLDASGILNYEIDEEGHLDTDKHFWTQAEAVVGFLNAWEITCQDEYLDTAVRTWGFIQKHLVDKEHGEWFWKVDGRGVADMNEPKISEWKGPYHNVRACIEIITRIDTLIKQQTGQKGIYTYG